MRNNRTAAVATFFHLVFVFSEILATNLHQFRIGFFTPGASSSFIGIIFQCVVFKANFRAINAREELAAFRVHLLDLGFHDFHNLIRVGVRAGARARRAA